MAHFLLDLLAFTLAFGVPVGVIAWLFVIGAGVGRERPIRSEGDRFREEMEQARRALRRL